MSGETEMRGVESSAQGGGVEEAREAQEAQGRVSGTRAGWSGQSTSGQSSPPRDGEGLSKPHHRRKTSISSLVASLFSVPPQKKLPSMTGGIYAVDGVHVDDEGRVMGMDPKYWIKDIDTGNVYSLEDNRGLDERGVGAAGASQTSASTSAAQGGTSGATSGAAGGAGGDGAALGTLHTAPTKKSTRPMGPMEQGIARASAEGIRSSARAPASVLATAGTRGPPSKGSGAIRVSDVFTTDGSNFDDSSKKTSRDLNQFEEALGYRRTADELGSKLAVQKQKGAHLPTLEDRAVSNSMLSRAGAKWWFTAVNAVKRELNLGHAQGHPQVVSDGNLVDSGIPGLCPSPSSPGSDGFGGPSKGQHGLRVKVVTSRKNFKEFSGLRLIQSVYAHEGVIWVAKFSPNGKFLATAGQDGTVTVWKTRTNRSLVAEDDVEKSNLDNSNKDNRDSDGAESVGPVNDNSDDDAAERPSVSYGSVPVLDPTPYRRYKGHKKDVLDLSWSSSNFLFSASMDKTVRLWHVSVDECLKIFRHNDFVTSIAVHPLNEALFLSGSIDGKVRLWNVPNATVNSWVDIHDMVTALNFNTDGSKAVVGSMRGKCRFYTLGTNNLLEYEASLDVKNKHGHNSRGRKITGLTYAPNKMLPNALLCTSNDSRVRLYDGYTLRFKYKGLSNKSTQIKASFSSKGNFVISGSDDGAVYIWDTSKRPLDPSADTALTSSGRTGGLVERTMNTISEPLSFLREKNASWESFQASDDVVTVAIFGPDCARLKDVPAEYSHYAAFGQIILVAGTDGEMKVYENRGGPTWL